MLVILFSTIIAFIIFGESTESLLHRDATTVRNLRARYDLLENAIFVEWDARLSEAEYKLRYKLSGKSRNNEWREALVQRANDATRTYFSRLEANDFANDDELHVQVKPIKNNSAESSAEKNWSDTLIISIAKRTPLEQEYSNSAAEAVHNNDEYPRELEPPTNFTANILAADTIRLEWARSPSEEQNPGLYYVVDIRQITTNDLSKKRVDKQIKVEANNFLLNDLTPGEHYEMTIRSAISANRVSSTAAIVDISLPKEDEFFEVGNLIVSSRFKTDGTGVVNLTWEVPPQLNKKIISYEVLYAENRYGEEQWRRASFSGDSSTASLYDLKSDTEYVLKITTSLSSGVLTESGRFRFKTPRVPTNPIVQMEVIHSSETPGVRLQWMLAGYLNPSYVIGYDIYITEDSDLKESEWRHWITNEPTIAIEDLLAAQTYYAKVKVRLNNGTLLDGSLIYKFQTDQN